MDNSIKLIPSAPGKAHESVYVYNSITTTVTHEIHNTPEEKMPQVESVFANRKKSDNYKPKKKHLYGSRLPIGNLLSTINRGENKETQHRVIWCRNSNFGCVASNQDRTTPHVQMMRQIATYVEGKDNTTDSKFKSTNYTGRADNEDRLKEQMQFILEQEFDLHQDINKIQGFERQEDNYVFTYALNTLTKLGKLQMPTGLDERISLQQELDLFSKDNQIDVNIGGKTFKVKPNPIHFHSNISKAGEIMGSLMSEDLSGKKLEKEINKKAYIKLSNRIPSNENKDLVNTLQQALKNPLLSLRARFIYKDILQRLANIIIVSHCKSSVDRAGTATAIGATNHHFLEKIKKLDGLESINEFIDSDEYKNEFFAQLCRSHQQTYPARYGMNETNNRIGSRLGFKMYGSLLTESLPKELVKESIWARKKGLRVFVSVIASLAYIILYPVIVGFMLSIGHLLLGICQLTFQAIKGKEFARRVGVAHALPYSLTPWNIHKIAIKTLNYDHDIIKKYQIDYHNH